MTDGTDALRRARKRTQRHARGEKPVGNAHCMLKYFSPKEHAEVKDTLVEHGGVPERECGVQNKEETPCRVFNRIK